MASNSTTLASVALPVTGLAVLLALGAAALVLLAGPGLRMGWWSLGTSFGLMRWGVYLALGTFAVALVAGVLAVLAQRWGLLGVAIVALAVAGAAFAGPIGMRGKAARVPPIHDISTDTEEPPAFQAVLPLRAGAPNPPEYAGADVAAQQHAAYPHVRPARFREAPAAVLAAAELVARRMGWEVVATDAEAGRLEAVATTAWFGFKDDVVLRIRAEDGATRVDMRSKSRLGRSDLGANAQRIVSFLGALRSAGLTPAE
jgi:uncharacterized protein (DUF1499 family)